MATLTNETITAKAIQLVIMDAIEKGHTNANELAQYMATEIFTNAVAEYKRKFEKEL